MPSPVEAIKRVPPMVWLIGGAVVVGVVVLKSGGGGGGAAPGGIVGGNDASGGGGSSPEDLLSQTVVDLADQIEQQAAADAEWRKGIEDAIAKGAPTNPNPATKVTSVHATNLRSIWQIKNGKLTKVTAKTKTGFNFKSTLGPVQRLKAANGKYYYYRKVLTGGYKGSYIHTSDKGLAYTTTP